MSFESSVSLKVKNAINTLKFIPMKEYQSSKCLENFKKIDASFYEEKASRLAIADIMVDLKYYQIVSGFMEHYTKEGIFESEYSWLCCFYLLKSVWNYTDSHRELALKCSCLIPLLLDIISDESLQPLEDEEDKKLFRIVLNILNNIAHQPEAKTIFTKHQASKFIQRLKGIDDDHLKVLVYLILAQIVNEDEFDKLDDTSDEVIEKISYCVKESLDTRRFKGISTSEYLDSMAKLAVTKSNKNKIIECGMLDILANVLSDSNQTIEHGFALECIWNLCFDEKAKEVVKSDQKLIDILDQLANSSSVSKELRSQATGILFTINAMSNKEEPSLRSGIKKIAGSSHKTHIMISYNCGSRDVCLKLNQELKVPMRNDSRTGIKSKGYQVWIDVEQIYGSSLASMAEAVENSSVFLMCVSEKYYMSPNCRLEAEYAIRLQKPIVPLIMQEDYMPLGWLGIIIGGKIYYKFTDPECVFEKSFTPMLKEVTRYYGHSFQVQTKSVNSALKVKCSNVSEWSQKNVNEWIRTLNLTSWIAESSVFNQMDGILLKELADMKNKAPEAFYSLLKEKFTAQSKKDTQNLELCDILKISHGINKLFNNTK